MLVLVLSALPSGLASMSCTWGTYTPFDAGSEVAEVGGSDAGREASDTGLPPCQVLRACCPQIPRDAGCPGGHRCFEICVNDSTGGNSTTCEAFFTLLNPLVHCP